MEKATAFRALLLAVPLALFASCGWAKTKPRPVGGSAAAPTASILVFKDWRLACPLDDGHPAAGCGLTSDVHDEETQVKLAAIAIGRSRDKAHRLEMVVTVPLTVLIAPDW